MTLRVVSGLFAMLFLTASADAVTHVRYRLDRKAWSAGVSADGTLTFQLFGDPACEGAPLHTEDRFAGDSGIRFEIPRSKKVRRGPKPEKEIRLRAEVAVTGLPGPLFAKVSGDGIVPLGGACQVQEATDSGRATGRVGTFFHAIDADACVLRQGVAVPGQCGGTSTVRTDGSQAFPCSLRSTANEAQTYSCALELPDGAIVEEIRAYGSDISDTGYFEAAAYGHPLGGISPAYLSSDFGGVWRSSGLAEAPGAVDFPLVQLEDDDVVIDNETLRYKIAVGIAETAAVVGSVHAYGFRIRYRIDP